MILRENCDGDNSDGDSSDGDNSDGDNSDGDNSDGDNSVIILHYRDHAHSDYLTMKAYTTNPFDQIFRRPHVVQCRPMILWPCYQLFLHHIPGYLADLMLILMGKKPR